MQIKTSGYKIEQTKNTNSFILSINHGSFNIKYIYEIYKSITKTKILSNAFFYENESSDSDSDRDRDSDRDSDRDRDNNLIGPAEHTINFTAENIKPLSTLLKEGKLTNRMAIKMTHDLSKQIAYLETNFFAFYGYELDDILVINNDIFLIASIKHLLKIEPDNCIYFYNPIDKPYFSNPELIKLTKIPSKIDYRSGYYSLGALILFSLTNIYIFSEIDDETLRIDAILEPIYYTKIFWFIRRCFKEKSEERILLFI
jgi:hypothetical protein